MSDSPGIGDPLQHQRLVEVLPDLGVGDLAQQEAVRPVANAMSTTPRTTWLTW